MPRTWRFGIAESAVELHDLGAVARPARERHEALPGIQPESPKLLRVLRHLAERREPALVHGSCKTAHMALEEGTEELLPHGRAIHRYVVHFSLHATRPLAGASPDFLQSKGEARGSKR